jgi:glycosyltransferase involved in cell wall biosynthesis
MKILEMESSKGWGGQEKRTVRLNNNLGKDYEIFWAVEKNSKLYKRRDEINGEFFTFKLNKIYNLFTIFSLVSFIKKHKIDIISTHSGKDAWIGNIVSKLTNTPVIRVRHLLTPVKSAKSYNMSTKVVCVSEQVREYLKSIGVEENKLEVIYTGIDTNKFIPKEKTLKKEWNIEENEIVVGIVAVLRSAKRHIDLIKAIKDIKNAKLVIVGNGPQEDNIKKFIKENSLENKVIMLGHREDIDTILPNLDIFVLPSNMEALGTAILEAESCGIPAIGSRVGGIPECIKENETGLLFETENIEELREKLTELINNPEKREKFGKSARELIIKNFSTSKMVEDTKTLYKRVINE